MNTEIDRLKQDLKTIGMAVGCGPEFNRSQVWRSIAWGITGLAITLLGILQAPPPWACGVMVGVLGIGLHYLLPRIACPDAPRVASTADNDLNFSYPLAGICLVFLLGLYFWLHKLALPPMVVEEVMLFLIGVVTGVWTWRRPWRRFALALAFALMALGIAFPFLHAGREARTMAIGAAFACGNFAGAVILHRQLKAHETNGQAAH